MAAVVATFVGAGVAFALSVDPPLSAPSLFVIQDTAPEETVPGGVADETHGVARTAPDVVDDPGPPASLTAPTLDPNGFEPQDDSVDDKAFQAYLEETERVVHESASELRTAVADAVDALTSGDVEAFGALVAPDEDADIVAVTALLERYPPIDEMRPVNDVGVFAVGDATVYFAYVDLTWTDAGHTSRHTIALPFRFIDGAWRLSTIDDRTDGLVPVQHVNLTS